MLGLIQQYTGWVIVVIVVAIMANNYKLFVAAWKKLAKLLAWWKSLRKGATVGETAGTSDEWDPRTALFDLLLEIQDCAVKCGAEPEKLGGLTLGQIGVMATHYPEDDE